MQNRSPSRPRHGALPRFLDWSAQWKCRDTGVSPVTGVVAWLTELDLERYADAFVEEGYENLGYIAEMSLEDVLDIKGMKKAYARRIHKAASNLKTP